MDNYILAKLRADSSHLISLSENENEIVHSGLRGRFRELLIDNILTPWLPPYIRCGTGTIIAAKNKKRQSTQDDIIIYDLSLTPPVLISNKAPEGVFLYNSVLARIEVKSTLTKESLRDFCISSNELSKLEFSVVEGFNQNLFGALNLLFAYKSDAKNDKDVDFELRRLLGLLKELNIDPLSGIVSMICVIGKGFWKIGLKKNTNNRIWQRLNSNKPEDHITWFVGCISNSCFQAHLLRQGRDPQKSLEGGIGNYLDHPFVDIDYLTTRE